ncbi:nucleotidyltransferase family protein [Rathayibacter sp. VKM Ac-2928]|uniref:nucleotidyltransferase family protein n=1 Tax=Rathayibacter sp. VKM Ac-2928 TaxID=2929479 RepID=UPI001FB301C2|nr:nucleotidyltransferase family protein [Rathayibacter sp. VKM Ac-2928]MCJ1682419.1 nucleotidyltransferase family protein [Rathayibacter sp. VKM Ac-2928]
MRPTVDLPLAAAVGLVHALVDDLARGAGIRALFLKGPIADAHRIRRPHPSSDADVLVAPGDADRLLTLLGERGWSVRPGSAAHRAFVTHSITLLHPSWPCDIDVHTSWPGFFIDPQLAFEVLWRTRCEVVVAGVPVRAIGFDTSVVVSALHSLRSPYQQRSEEEFEELVAVVAARGREEAVVARAAELGCLEPIAPFLARIGATVALPARPSRQYALWRLRTRRPSRTADWLLAIDQAPTLAERLVLLRRALHPAGRDLVIDHPLLPPTASARLAIRARRFAAATRALLPAIRDLVAVRRASRADADPSAAPSFAPGSPAPVGGAPAPAPVTERTAQATGLVVDGARTTCGPSATGSRVAAMATPQRLYLLPLGAPAGAQPVVLQGSARLLWERFSAQDARSRAGADAVVRAADDLGDVLADGRRAEIEQLLDELVELGLLTA